MRNIFSRSVGLIILASFLLHGGCSSPGTGFPYQLKVGKAVFHFKSQEGEYQNLKENMSGRVRTLLKDGKNAFVTVDGIFMEFKGDYYSDGMKNRLYYGKTSPDNHFFVLDVYPYVIGGEAELKKYGGFYVLTDSYMRGGSGGHDALYFLRIFSVLGDSIRVLFDEQIGYGIEMETAADVPEHYGYYAFSGNDLYLLLTDSPLNDDFMTYVSEIDLKKIQNTPGVLRFVYGPNGFNSAQNEAAFRKLRKVFE